MYPDNSNNKQKPFFWILLSYTGKNWCNECSGWAISPEEAWNIAYQYYINYEL